MRNRKLFVVTAGTVAAGVGQELERQVDSRPESGLNVMVRYIDTARLTTRYPNIRDGEWFQMKVDPMFMKAIAKERKRYPRLDQLLYDKLLPKPTGHGGGSIRYNGAGSVVVNRDKMKKWLSANMTSLMRQQDGQTNFSVAIIASSVGATGSGSLEQLADVVAEAAAEASIPLPIQIDFFILQPGMEGVSQLGLANTLALYAELAATRLAQDDQDDIDDKDYQGRIIMVGWGSQRMLSSIEQLQETTATLVRLVNDNASKIVAEYQERAVDNHVLLQIDELTGLPSHLSTATPVTISLGGLEEQIIQRDAARLIDNLVFGEETGSSGGRQELFIGTLKDAMEGSTPDERYASLLSYLAEDAGAAPRTLNKRFRDQIIASQPQDILARLEGAWNSDKNVIAQSVTEMRTSGNRLTREISNSWIKLRNDTMATSSVLSLSSLQREYRYLSSVLNELLKFARNDTAFIDDNAVLTQFKQLDQAVKANNRNAERNRLAAADSAIRQVQNNIRGQLERRASPIAIDVLEDLFLFSSEAQNKLEAVLQRLHKQKDTLESWSVTKRPLSAGNAHPLELVALSYEKRANEPSEVERYYDRISILENHSRGRARQTTEIDQLASFRKWLNENNHMEDLFKGDIDLLLRVARDHTRMQVHDEIKKHSVLDILIQGGEQTLPQRLSEAASLSSSLVNFNEGFAPDREEVWHVCAYWQDSGQRDTLQKEVDRVFGQGRCILLESSDPTEIVVFYYVDGIPMSAVNDLTGRCLESFLKQRQNWYRYSGTTGSNGTNNNPGQRVSIPIYSGKHAETLVLEKDIISKLCNTVARRYAIQFPHLLELQNSNHEPEPEPDQH